MNFFFFFCKKACEKKNVLMTLSSLSTTSMKDVMEFSPKGIKLF
jgi:hypothetical protein